MRSLAAAPIIAAILAAHFSVSPQIAAAGDSVRHDLRVERAAAEIVAAKIGDLRGSQAHDADPMALIEPYRRPLRLKEMPGPVPGAIPPVVSNEKNARDPLLDRTVTGTIKLY